MAMAQLSPEARAVVRSYMWISGLFWLSASVIWGVNTLFLLDAGLTLFQTFIANAAWTAGMVVFEVPTGLVADTLGRRVSYLLSAAVLALGTFGYVAISWVGGGLMPFVLVSVVLGLAYTFYSGAVEAWMVDALRSTGYGGDLDPIFARGGVVTGAAMLVGTVAGGLLGTLDLSFPYLARVALLLGSFGIAFATMRDVGFTPRAMHIRDLPREVRAVARASIQHGWRRPSVRLLMMVSLVQFSVAAWAFYAWQPYFLDLLNRPDAIWVAGVVAALIALAGIIGNSLVGKIMRPGIHRSTFLLAGGVAYAASLAIVGMTSNFFIAAGVYLLGVLIGAMARPVKQAYLHEVIPTEQRATVVSFDSLFGSLGSVGGQAGLGYLAQVRSIASGFVASGAIAFLAIPFMFALRRLGEPADHIRAPETEEEVAAEVAATEGGRAEGAPR